MIPKQPKFRCLGLIDQNETYEMKKDRKTKNCKWETQDVEANRTKKTDRRVEGKEENNE